MSLTKPPPRFRLRDLRRGVEPSPLALITRQPWHPCAIIAIACIGAFTGKLSSRFTVRGVRIAGMALCVVALIAAILATVRYPAGAKI